MDKAKAFRKTGVVSLSIWIIVWIGLIYISISHVNFRDYILTATLAMLINWAINPCAFIGAILLGLAGKSENPRRKSGWFRFAIIYVILWVPIFLFVLWVTRPRGFGPGLKMIEKPIKGLSGEQINR